MRAPFLSALQACLHFICFPGAARFALAPGYLIPRLRRSAQHNTMCACGAPRATLLSAPPALGAGQTLCVRLRRSPWLPYSAPPALGAPQQYVRLRRSAGYPSVRASGARRSTTLCAPAALRGLPFCPLLRRSGQSWLPSDPALARSQKCASAASTRCVDVPKDDGHRVGGDRVFRVCCIEENREGAVAETADAFVDHSLISLERFAGEATRIVFVNYL